jgi:hypothetical protein
LKNENTHKKYKMKPSRLEMELKLDPFEKNQFDYGFPFILGTGFGFSSNFNLFKS